MIEAFGVPHTEVELILVNGESAGFDRLLRMAGFDTFYRNDFADREIADIAIREARIVLTRDRELLKLRGPHLLGRLALATDEGAAGRAGLMTA